METLTVRSTIKYRVKKKHSIVLGWTSNEKTLGSRNTIIICAKWSIIAHLKAQNMTNVIHSPTPTKSPIEVF